MTATSYKLGREAKILYSTTPSTALASLSSEIDQAQDVTCDFGRSGGSAINSRASQGWAEEAPGLKTGQVSFSFVVKPTTDQAAADLEDAYLNDSEICAAILDGDEATAGTRGPRANWFVENFKRNEPLDGAITVDVNLKISEFLAWEVVS